MTENDIKTLSRQAPKARDAAKSAALAAAMQAYDAAGRETETVRPQGSRAGGRLIPIATSIWSRLMKQRLMVGPALATLMILPAAGYVTWQITQDLAREQAEYPVLTEREDDAAARKSQPAVALEPLPAPAPEPYDTPGYDTSVMTDVPAVLAPQSVVARGESRGVPRMRAMPEMAAGAAREAGSVDPYAPQILDEEQALPGHVIETGRDRVESTVTNDVKSVVEAPVSTFSADVDTASYAMVRRALKQGYLPDPATVRVEEMINYFSYAYPGPDSAEQPFHATVTVTPTPWNADTKLLHIGVKGYDVTPAARPRANLVFLIDVSGSMNETDKLPLLKSAFRMLVGKLEPEDTVSIVTYAGEAGTVLEPTPVSERRTILDAMDQLQPGGSTAGAAGIEEAYRLAEKAFVEGGVNRVMLATDGDFNVGASDDAALKTMIERKRESGVFLSVFGFGQGNYNDQLMQALAQNGNGVAAYIDTLAEAEKTLVQEASASLFPIASDVKFQVEFNPALVAEYRQIGFETRTLARQDFNNDRVDAGEIGSGHTVTAIYEITPVGSPAVLIDGLRYGDRPEAAATGRSDEIAFLRIRAKAPGESESKLTEIPVTGADAVASFIDAPEDVRFSVAVAAFGQKLRRTDQLAGYGYDAIEDLASDARGKDPFGYRSEFLQLVRLAESLDR